MTLDTIGVTRATLLTAKIALTADKMRYEHLLMGVVSEEYAKQYAEVVQRIDAALKEINHSLES